MPDYQSRRDFISGALAATMAFRHPSEALKLAQSAVPTALVVEPETQEPRYWTAQLITNVMAPVYKRGAWVILDHQAEPAEGDDALIELVGAPADHHGIAVNVEWQDMWSVGCQTYTPRRTFTFNRSEIKRIVRIVPIPEYYGWV